MNKLFWIDMEMTGLDPDENRILEIAILITDHKLDIIDRFHAVIRTPKAILDGMDEWNTRTHTSNGLVKEAVNGRFIQEVEIDLLNLADKHFANKQIFLCGSSLSLDRMFIEKFMPSFAKKLHYRIVDVSSWKAIFQTFLDLRFHKQDAHRAMNDIEESLRELKLYLSYIDSDKLPEVLNLNL
ncbi:oligoribonuclease [Lentisphaera araneosa HTCC2155]|uniref:Oligoribonuclease n=1 Tax=Lentisphaera araneosa HTCC2155 TaxID=313628 RepID=A6DMP4_9BACT|nr:oligoribonuclease [Lentisphaera araneosa]EDM27234.1 oligoribonuclease [Lentisphaera araneosa HTCC2155]